MNLLFIVASFVLAALLAACGTNHSAPPGQPAAKAPAPAALPLPAVSYAAALLQSGLVAPAHRPWVLFCDTTRQPRWQLGRTPPEVWSWLADYEQRLAEGQSLSPAAPERRPTALDKRMAHEKISEPIRLPATAAEMRATRARTTQLVRQLRQAHLLTAAQYRQLRPLAAAGEFASRRYLLENLRALTASAHELRQSAALIPGLQAAGLLAPPAARQLARDLRQGVFTDPVEVLSRLPHARVFSRRDYPGALLPYLRQLHQDAASLLPELSFRDFQVQVLTPGEMAPCLACPGQQDALVSLRLGGRTYYQRSELLTDAGQAGLPYSRITTDFYQLFNQALTDQRSPRRLLAVESSQLGHTMGVQSRFGLLALTRPQLNSLFGLQEKSGQRTPLEISGLAYSQAFEFLPTDTVLAALRTFERLGLLRHLPAPRRRAAAARVRQFRLTKPYQVLHCLPSSVGEYLGAPAFAHWSYTRLLRVLARESDQQFAPTQVLDNCRQRAGTLRFRLGTGTYQTPLDAPTETPDPRLFRLLERAMREQHVAGNFYQVGGDVVPAAGMAVGYLFLRPAVAQALRHRHLLPLENPALTQQQRFAAEEQGGD